MERGEVHPPHGVETTYFNYMCRCELCRRAHNARQLERIRRRRQRLSDEYVRTLLEGMRDEQLDAAAVRPVLDSGAPGREGPAPDSR